MLYCFYAMFTLYTINIILLHLLLLCFMPLLHNILQQYVTFIYYVIHIKTFMPSCGKKRPVRVPIPFHNLRAQSHFYVHAFSITHCFDEETNPYNYDHLFYAPVVLTQLVMPSTTS